MPIRYKYTLKWDDFSICYLPLYETHIDMNDMCGILSLSVDHGQTIVLERCDLVSYRYIMCEDNTGPQGTAGG